MKMPGFIKRWIGNFVFSQITNFVNKKVLTMQQSKKTTITGWLTLGMGLLGAAISLITGEGFGDMTPVMTALTSIGVSIPGWLQGLFAKDGDVTHSGNPTG